MSLSAKEKKSQAGREVGCAGGEGKEPCSLQQAGREGLVEQRFEGAKGASFGDLWGRRGPGKEKEQEGGKLHGLLS